MDRKYLDWPFLEPRHKELAIRLDAWAGENLSSDHEPDVDQACSTLVKRLGEGGWLQYTVGGTAYGALSESIDTRAVCLIRETLARHSGLADFAFAMQGLGSGAITLFGSETQKRHYLARTAQGSAIAAFAISEPEAGSDVAALSCRARLDGDGYVLNGEKTWISNGGLADYYVLFARTGEPGARGLSDFQLTQARLAAMAKMIATETAQNVIDAAVQIFGGQGVVSGEPIERLYREIRPLRIYEGATEVQQPIIARGIIKAFENEDAHSCVSPA